MKLKGVQVGCLHRHSSGMNPRQSGRWVVNAQDNSLTAEMVSRAGQAKARQPHEEKARIRSHGAALKAGTGSDSGLQDRPATAPGACPLRPSKGCLQAQWCLDKSRLAQAHLHDRKENVAANARCGSEALQPQRAARILGSHATFSALRAETGSPKRNQEFQRRAPASSEANRPRPEQQDRVQSLQVLRRLEALQALAQARCWLLRSCVVPLGRLLGKWR